MMKKLKTENDDRELITKGFFRTEIRGLMSERIDPLEQRIDSIESKIGSVEQRIDSFEKNMNDRFEKFGEIILTEFAAMRKDHKELMQRCDSLDRNDIRQELEYDKLEKRVFNLEIAK